MAIYVSDKYQFQLCPVQYELTSSECLRLEVSEVNNNKSTFIVGAVYRHPTQTTVNNFLDGFSYCLSHLSNFKASYYILGDFNKNLCPVRRLPSANDYIKTIISNGAVTLITKSTRVIKTSSTILDHIITNNFEVSLNPAVIETDITDHYPILCAIEKPISKFNPKPEIKYFRDRSAFRADSFCEDLHQNLLNSFSDQPPLTIENFNELFNLFSRVTLSTIDKHALPKTFIKTTKKAIE